MNKSGSIFNSNHIVMYHYPTVTYSQLVAASVILHHGSLLGGDSGRYAPKEVHQVYNHFYNNISKSRFRHPFKDRIRFGSR